MGRLKEEVSSVDVRVTHMESEITELQQDVTSIQRDVKELRREMERNHSEVIDAIGELKELFVGYIHGESGEVRITFSYAHGR